MRLVGQGQTKMWGVRQLGGGKLRTPRRSGGSETSTRTPDGGADDGRVDRATTGRGSASTTQGSWNEKRSTLGMKERRGRKEETREVLLTNTTEAAALVGVIEVGVEGAFLMGGLPANRGHVRLDLETETALGGEFDVDPMRVGQTHETLGDVAAPKKDLVTQAAATPDGTNEPGRDGTRAIPSTQRYTYPEGGERVRQLVVRGDGGVVRGDGDAGRDPVFYPARSHVRGRDGLVGRDETAAEPTRPLSDGGDPRARLRHPVAGRRARVPMNGEEMDVGVTRAAARAGVDQKDPTNDGRS